jgi:S-(hydroxymethyl)glutathione dehydrogenase/alcohol dehydrogenase
VIVATGAASAIERGVRLLRRGGTLVAVGMPPSGAVARIDPSALAHDGLRILGSKLGGTRPAVDLPRLAGLYLDGLLDLDALVSGRHPLERIGDALAAARRGEGVRAIVVPDAP